MTHNRRNIVAVTGSVLIIAALVATVSLKASAITNQMHAWKLLPEQERITELYFTNASKLPTTYTTAQTQTVSFAAHNLEYRPTTYHYTITQLSLAGTQQAVLEQGDFQLKQNQTTELHIPVALQDFGTSKVQVHLQTGETIDYIISKAGL